MHKILAQLKAMTKLTEFSGQKISLTYSVYHNGLLNSSPDFIGVNYQFLQLNFLQAVHCKTRTLSNKKMKIRWPFSTSYYQKITNVPNPHKTCLVPTMLCIVLSVIQLFFPLFQLSRHCCSSGTRIFKILVKNLNRASGESCKMTWHRPSLHLYFVLFILMKPNMSSNLP